VRFRLFRWLTMFGAVIFFSHAVVAQTFRGGINGIVSDSSGAAISQAKVTAINTATEAVYATTTSGAGEFLFNDLPLGDYKVTVTASGFQTTGISGVTVSSGNLYTLPIRLKVAQQATTVEVSADSLALDTTTSSQNMAIENKSIQDIPLNGRDFSQLIDESVAFAGYAGTGSVNGTRAGQVNYQIEGSDNNDLYINFYAVNQPGVTGIAATVLPIDAIDEFSLQTAGNSEVGRNPGGVQNLAIKSGTNQVHGSAYYYNRNEALAAETPFAPPGEPKNALRNQNWGGTVGGPLWRNHTFFFLGYEEQKYLIGNQAEATEPSAAYQAAALAVLNNANDAYGNYAAVPESQVSANLLATFWPTNVLQGPASPNNYFNPNPSNGYSHNILAKVDDIISDKQHLSARWFFGQGSQTAPNGTHISEYYIALPSHIENFDVIYNVALRPNLTNQILAGVNYFVQVFSDAVHDINPSTVGLDTGITNPSLFGAPNIAITGFDPIGQTPLSGRNDITAHLTDAISWTVGKHQLRLGGEYRRAYIDIFYNFGGRGFFGFDGAQGPWSGVTSVDSNTLALADFLAGYDFQDSITRGNQERFLYSHVGSAYAQDSFQVTSKFNFNYGVRYDYQQPIYSNAKNLSTFIPSQGGLVVAGDGVPYIYPSDKTSFSPRLGFAWQFQPDLVLRGSYGIYFDQPAAQSFINDASMPNNGAVGAIDNPVGANPVFTITENGVPGVAGWQLNQPVFPSSEQSASGSNVLAIYSANQNFRNPYTEMFGLNLERSLGQNWILTAAYVGSESHKNTVIRDINQAALGSGNNPTLVTGPNGGTFTYQQSTRPYFQQFPNYGIINQVDSGSDANYNALQLTLRVRAWHGLNGQFAYAWSHNLDNTTAVCCTNPEDSFNLNRDYGNSNYDIRQHFSSYLTYDIPGGDWGPKWLLHGWELANLLHFNTGEPFPILVGTDSSGTTENQDRPNISGNPTAGVQRNLVDHQYVQWINPAVFSTPTYGTWGNLRRNQITGPGFADVDFSVLKNTPLWGDRVRSQFRVEIFNLFNRLNLAPPFGTLGAGFGQSSDTIGDYNGAPGIGPGEPFNVQLSLKILF
jgi:hypothetical protein